MYDELVKVDVKLSKKVLCKGCKEKKNRNISIVPKSKTKNNKKTNDKKILYLCQFLFKTEKKGKGTSWNKFKTHP